MATQIQNPFTNTRLMLAGVACGCLGILLAVIHVNRVVKKRVGEEVTVYYMTQILSPDTPLDRTHYRKVKVSKKFVEEADKMITAKIETFHGAFPRQQLNPGEPLVSTWFDSHVGKAGTLTPPVGLKAIPIPVTTRLWLGGVDVGSIVSVIGKFRFGEKDQDDYQERTLRLLENVQVQAINGQVRPDARARKRVTSITVYLGKETSLRVNAMLDLKIGDMKIEGESEGARKSEANKEIPREVLEIIKEKLDI